MRMYCPSLKENVEATITDGKQVASKGGSLRNILYGEYEGRKCLPKTVKAEVFAQHGFAAEFHLKEDFTEGIDDDMIAIHNEKGKRVGMVSVENAGGDDDVNVAITYPVSPPFYTGALKEETVLIGDEAYDIRSAESKFDKLSHEIAEEYEEKGKTPEEAQEIGDATAAKIGRIKYGKKGMERKSLKGKEAETISKDMTFNIDIEDASIENEDELEERGYSQDDIEQMREEITSNVDADRILEDIKSNHLDSIGGDTYYIEDEYGVYLKNRDEMVDDVEATIDYDVDAGGWSAETFEAYDDPISDRQEWKINSLGGTVDSSMNRSEASDYIKELQGRKSGTWKDAESSPSSFDISWEDAQGVSSPSLPPEGIHFSEDEPRAIVLYDVVWKTKKDLPEGVFISSYDEETLKGHGEEDIQDYLYERFGDYAESYKMQHDGGNYNPSAFDMMKRFPEKFDEYGAEGEDYGLNGENCDYCAETRELNAEGFCSECAHHADYFNARSYEDAFRSESVSYASEGLTRNGKFALGLTALGVGIAMAMGSEKVASLLDRINRK